MIREHDLIAMLHDRTDLGLHRGDVGAVVHIYKNGETFEVEFVDERGKTMRVATVAARDVMRLNYRLSA